jgi:hypothetical protein
MGSKKKKKKKDIHNCLSPPDPFTNYNIACEAHDEGTAEWFFQGKKFKGWMSIGSLLWIHGKRKFVIFYCSKLDGHRFA